METYEVRRVQEVMLNNQPTVLFELWSCDGPRSPWAFAGRHTAPPDTPRDLLVDVALERLDDIQRAEVLA